MEADKNNPWTIKKLFEDMRRCASSQEKRKSHRICCSVEISLKNTRYSARSDAECVNISFKGMGIKIDSFKGACFFPDDPIEVWIKLSEHDAPLHRYGRLAWFKKIDSLRFRGGIAFMDSSDTGPLVSR